MMRPGYLGDLGIITAASATILTAAGNVALNVHHTGKTSKLQKRFQAQMDRDEVNLDYVRIMLTRFQGIGSRLVATSTAQPGTATFEALLKKHVGPDIVYKGNCDANLLTPVKPGEENKPRQILAKLYRSGHIEGRLPRDAGPMWAGGCKNAQDNFRIAWLEKTKGQKQFERLKTTREDIGSMNLWIKVVVGLLVAGAFISSIKIQKKVISSQNRP